MEDDDGHEIDNRSLYKSSYFISSRGFKVQMGGRSSLDKRLDNGDLEP